MLAIGNAFIDRSRRYLGAEYLPKLRRCLETVEEEDLWWRPNVESNSIGNLVLHLAGNVRQWVISGVGGEPDVRQRPEEFAAESGLHRRELLELIERTVREADRVLARVTPELLPERRVIQGHEVSVLEAIYHAVEHFGMHTGQIIYIAKLRTSKDLSFYEVEAGIPRPRW